jgi:hypothetical protein
VVVALVLEGEEDHRDRAITGHAWWIKQWAAVLERRRNEAEEGSQRHSATPGGSVPTLRRSAPPHL